MAHAQEGPGDGYVGGVGIVLGIAYLAIATILILRTLFAIWPHPTPAGVPAPGERRAIVAADTVGLPDSVRSVVAQNDSLRAMIDRFNAGVHMVRCNDIEVSGRMNAEESVIDPECVTLFGKPRILWAEHRLLLIVLLSGALGGLLHGLRSLPWYVGHRTFKWSWAAMYALLPFVGAAIAFVFYVVVRGGFFSPSSSFSETSPFGFAAMAAVVGMFSTQAILKLKQVAETMLTRPVPGEDARPQGGTDEGPAAASGGDTAGTAAGGTSASGATATAGGAGAATGPLVDHAVGNPVPMLTRIEPSTVAAGGVGAPIKVSGKGFIQGALLRIGTTDITPRSVEPTHLVADVPAELLQKEATHAVLVVNPAPGGGPAPRPRTLRVTTTPAAGSTGRSGGADD